MSVTLSSSGTRGVTIPGFAKPLMAVGMGISHLAFGLLGDRMKIQGRPLLELTTVGARTGKRRRVILAWFDDPANPGARIIVGSNGGATRHPGWCHNLAHNPDKAWIEVGGEEIKVRPDSLHDGERAAHWARIVALAPGYGGYTEKTDREIPVIRLTPVDG
ncbi:MAG TPA: nitroreductase family deazaflavin-dependent oxidoreductase [Acidimicrobiia bacterium]|nr:nitroreductase family deazaflavin-dependent oxidoreductase [Acidimicrobiia bacterium]